MASKISGLVEKINMDGILHSIASTAYGYCETAAATTPKVVEMTGFQLLEGVTIYVKFKERNNVSNPKLKIKYGSGDNDVTAEIPIVLYATAAVGTGDSTTGWYAGAVVSLTYDGTSWVKNQGFNSDNDSTGYYHRRIYPNLKAGTGGIDKYVIIMLLPNGRWSGIVPSSQTTASNGAVSPKATGKTASTNQFILGHILVMYANATYANGANVGTYNIWSAYSGLIDARYSFNLENTEGNRFIGYTPVYIVGTVSNGLFTLDSTKWWALTLPSSEDGKVYIYIGDAYDWYRLTFVEDKPIYWYKDGAVRLYSGASEYALDAGTVNGLTVLTAVPANALFTDTNKYHKSGSWNGLTYTATAVNGADELKFTIPDNYGDTKNPYASKTKNYVLAAPSSANGVPSFRALVAADIPDLSGTYVKKVTSTDNAIARFDGTGGAVQNSTVTIDDSGNITFPSGATTSVFPSHYYTRAYDSNGNTYVHYYQSGASYTNSYANFRVKKNNSFETLRFGGDGTFTWRGYPVTITNTNNGTVGAIGTPVYVEAGVIKAGTALGASAYHADSYFIKAITSTDNAVVRYDGTSGLVLDSGVTIDDNNIINGYKTLKYTTRIYPFVTSGEKSAWYKITFPYATATTSSSAKWFMNSFDLHFGGGYNANPSGVAHITYYWYRAVNNGAWSLSLGEALIEGTKANKIVLYYRIAEPGILYVNNTANTYNGIWIDNLYVDDTAPSLDWSTTKIENVAAITNDTDPALSAYTKLTTTYLYNDNGVLKTNAHFEGQYIKGTWLYTSAATAKTSTAKLATIESDNFIYYITPANALKSAIGTTTIGGASTPIYWDGSTFTAGTALSDGAYKSILNNTSVGALGWNSGGNTNADNLRLVNVNTIAYWNGAYSGTNSNLTYYKGGAFGTMAKETATDYAKLASPTFTGTPKSVTPSSTSDAKMIATKEYVDGILAANDALVYKGTKAGASASTNGGTLMPAGIQGDTYKVSTAGYINGVYCEVGDMIICVTDVVASTTSNYSTTIASWNIVQTSDGTVSTSETSVTEGQIPTFKGTTGKFIQNSSKSFSTATPTSSSTDAQIPTAKAVWAAIDGLDVSNISGFGVGKTLKTLSQSNGKISATFLDISVYQLATIGDQRSTATTPNTYANKFIFQGLKYNTTINSPSSNTYSYVVGLRGWSDSSGGDSHELAFNNNGIYWRHGATTTWESWEKLAMMSDVVASQIEIIRLST